MRSKTSTTRIWLKAPCRGSALVSLLCLAPLLAALAGCAPEVQAPRVAAFDPDSIPDAFARPSAALFEAGSTRGFHVNPDGALDDGAVIASFAPSADDSLAGPPKRIAYEDRWLPVAHWRRWSGNVRFDFEAVARPHAPLGDSALWASVVVTATNLGAAPARAALVVTLASPEQRRAFVAYDLGPEDEKPVFAGRGVRVARAWTDMPHASAGNDFAGWRENLAPGASAATRVVLSSYSRPTSEFANWTRITHARRVEEARGHWHSVVARGARFELGDPETESALRAAWVVLLSCRERRGPEWVPIGGPFHYRDVWLRDGARVVSALAVSGFGHEAMQLARGLSLLQWDDGSLLSQRGQLDGLGQGPWAYAQAALRRAPDTMGVAHLAESALRVWRYRQASRAFAMESGWATANLLPMAEPRDCEMTRAQLVGNDAWALAGSEATARLLRAAGRPREADSVEATLTRDRAEFAEALARTGRADIPPSWQLRGLDWGNLAVGWPCRALPPGDPHLAATAQRVWRAVGGAGLTCYGLPDSLHGYVGADLGTWALLAGRRAEADSVLDALLHWRNASGAGAEIILRGTREFSDNLPPHPTSAAALVALVRNSLIFDDDDTLRVALGARLQWWKGARVTGAPTRWGRVDLELRASGDSASWRWTRVPVWTELALPPGTRLAGAPPAGCRPSREGRSLLAAPGTAELSTRIEADVVPQPRAGGGEATKTKPTGAKRPAKGAAR